MFSSTVSIQDITKEFLFDLYDCPRLVELKECKGLDIQGITITVAKHTFITLSSDGSCKMQVFDDEATCYCAVMKNDLTFRCTKWYQVVDDTGEDSPKLRITFHEDLIRMENINVDGNVCVDTKLTLQTTEDGLYEYGTIIEKVCAEDSSYHCVFYENLEPVKVSLCHGEQGPLEIITGSDRVRACIAQRTYLGSLYKDGFRFRIRGTTKLLLDRLNQDISNKRA